MGTLHENADFSSQKRKQDDDQPSIWENTGGWSPFFSLQGSVLGATRHISGFHYLKAPSQGYAVPFLINQERFPPT